MIPVKILNRVCNQMRDLNGSEYWSSLGAAGVCETVEYFKESNNLLELLALIGGAVISCDLRCKSDNSKCKPCAAAFNLPSGDCIYYRLGKLYDTYCSKKKRYKVEGTDCHNHIHLICGIFPKEVADKLCYTLNESLKEGINTFNIVYEVMEVRNGN